MPHVFQLPEYSVFLGPLAGTLSGWLAERRYSQIFIITDTHTRAFCLPLLESLLPTRVTGHTILPGEQFKNLDSCQEIWQSMLDAQADRNTLVINLGGGVVGDMGGFCAATFKRGAAFIQIPTTLLSMTDAAIGGKLGVDFRGVKNTIGVFQHPAAVFADPVFLNTLPPRELRSGFAEVLKHALIGDPLLWEKIQTLPGFDISAAAALNRTDWEALLSASIAVKVHIVAEDPLEKGLRALLNFGHTIGHAVESYFLQTPEPLTHGEAVAIGMICELASGEPAAAFERITATILRYFGHQPIPESAFPIVWDFLLQDKKNVSGKVRMALPDTKPFSLRLADLSREEAERRLRYYNSLVDPG